MLPASTLEPQRHRDDLSRKHDISLCLRASVASIYQIVYGLIILKNALKGTLEVLNDIGAKTTMIIKDEK
jgi:hypothetical protein